MLTKCMVTGVLFASIWGVVAGEVCFGIGVNELSAKTCHPHKNEDGSLTTAGIIEIVLGSIFGVVFLVLLGEVLCKICKEACRYCYDKVTSCCGNCHNSCSCGNRQSANAINPANHTSDTADEKELPRREKSAATDQVDQMTDPVYIV